MGGRGTAEPSAGWRRRFESFSPGGRPYGEVERWKFGNWTSELPGRPWDGQPNAAGEGLRCLYQLRAGARVSAVPLCIRAANKRWPASLCWPPKGFFVAR